ncbi:MAG: iron-sulfur cluster assembly scaffold protein [Verrucomicrobiales bacterium]|nr:iron-sulfur cluster assembly scaffold protein [Verrucomicrobiales bacterium]
MNDDLQKRITEAMANPQNMGELPDADAVGTVGNAECGDMLRVWVKYKEERGKKVIDRASFQSFGCETAIAAASLAMQLIRGKTPEEALALSGQELATYLGPLPPTKVHCASLVESAIRSALAPEEEKPKPATPTPPESLGTNLIDSFTKPAQKEGGLRVVLLDKGK